MGEKQEWAWDHSITADECLVLASTDRAPDGVIAAIEMQGWKSVWHHTYDDVDMIVFVEDDDETE